jgi:hypothetical protein
VDAVDHGYPDPPNTREVKLGLCCGASVPEDNIVRAVAGDVAGESIEPL